MLLLKAVTRDRYGKVVGRVRLRKSKSFVKGYNWTLLCQQLQQSSPSPSVSPFQDITGANWGGRNCAIPWRCLGNAGDATEGIVVGTDGSAPDISDYRLGAVIAHGTGAGQMEYQAQTFAWIGIVGIQCSFEMRRTMVNNSGGTINVAECGLYTEFFRTGSPMQRDCCSAHDLISQSVPDGGSITVTYVNRIVL